MPGRPGLAMAVFSGALPRSGATSGHPATAPEPLYLLDKRNKPRSLLAAGFFVNRLVRQFRTANSSSPIVTDFKLKLRLATHVHSRPLISLSE